MEYHGTTGDTKDGKERKFTGRDAIDSLLAAGVVRTEEEGEEVMKGLEREGLVSPSKGTKRRRAGKGRFRFVKENGGTAEPTTQPTTPIPSPPSRPLSLPPHPPHPPAPPSLSFRNILTFITSLLILLHPHPISSLLPKLFGITAANLRTAAAFAATFCVLLLLRGGGRGGEAARGGGAGSDGREEGIEGLGDSTTGPIGGSSPLPASELANIPTVKAVDVPSSLRTVQAMITEFQWIQAGRLLEACSLSSPGTPEKLLGKETVADVRSRHRTALAGLDLLSTDVGWSLFKVSSTGTKVYSKRTPAAPNILWVKCTATIDVGASAVAAVWKEGDLYADWFPQCGWARIIEGVSEAEIVSLRERGGERRRMSPPVAARRPPWTRVLFDRPFLLTPLS